MTNHFWKRWNIRFNKRTGFLLAVTILTIYASAFKTRKTIYYWLIFSQAGIEKSISNYSMAYMEPAHEFDPLTTPKINWFRVEDINSDGTISFWEFNIAFETYDQVNTLSNLLSDEFTDIYGELDLCNRP